MSRARHEGVTCDVCNAQNFVGKRYKCLICYDYDLCARCYDGGLARGTHSREHAVQCILTKSDFDIHFAGENLSYQRSYAYTCPVCCSMGFTVSRLREHVLSEHGRSHREVICPVCATSTSSSHNSNNMVAALGNHLTTHLAAEQSSASRTNSTEERLASIRRHLSPSQDQSQGGAGSGGAGAAAGSSGTARRRTSGTTTTTSSNNGTHSSDPRYASDLRSAWLPSSAARVTTSSQTATTTAPSWSASRAAQGLEHDLGDYAEYLSLHDSILHGTSSDRLPERLRERLAAEAGRHGDPNSPLYRYLAHPRFAGSGLRAAATTSAAGQPSGQSSAAGQQQQQRATAAAAQFPSNSWECLMNSSAPGGEFILPGLLDDEALLSCSDSEALHCTEEDRAGFASDLLLSLLDVGLDEGLLEHLEALSSDSEPEPSLETDV